MPGVVGFVARSENADVNAIFLRIMRPMERGGRGVTECAVDAEHRWALGRVHLNVLQPRPQLSSSRIKTLFHGDLFNQDELRALVQEDIPPRSTGITDLLAALYRRFGASFAGKLSGSFCAVVLDEEAQRLLLLSDRLGSYPVYWLHSQEGFAFGSELRGVIKAQSKPALDARTVNDLLHFGFPLGDKTPAAGIRLLPSASTLTYDWHADRVTIDPYASWGPAFRASGINKADYLNAVSHAFTTSMERSVAGSQAYGLSLSGGLDTRVLLSALTRMGIPLSTFTLGERGCADEVIAYKLAEMSGSHHRFVPLEERYLSDLLPMAQKMVSLTDGMYTSHGFTEVLALNAFAESNVTMLLRGHAGELAKASTAWPLHTDPQIFAMQSAEALVPYLLVRLESLNHGQLAQGVFTDGFREAADHQLATKSLQESIDVDLGPPDLCSYLYLHEYHRRVTVPSLEIFRNVVEVRLPLADADFVECVLQAPPKWRDGVEIHQALIARNASEFLKVRNPNTGAPAGAGRRREFVFDKLNTLLRRLNVYGYRHYHAFDGWMRQAFVQTARQVLFDQQTLERGVVKESALTRLLERAETGDGAPDHVLQVLVLIELWQRENL